MTFQMLEISKPQVEELLASIEEAQMVLEVGSDMMCKLESLYDRLRLFTGHSWTHDTIQQGWVSSLNPGE